MKVAILHDQIAPHARPDEQDALVQAKVVDEALRNLGHETVTLAFEPAFETFAAGMRSTAPDIVFNLVESTAGHGRLIHCAPSWMDALGILYTGASAEATFSTSNKLIARQLMARAGLPVPVGHTLRSLRNVFSVERYKYIIKSVWEHASIGLDASAIVETDDADVLAGEIERRLPLLGGDAFAEQFVEGREFNLAALGEISPENPPLPPAEIQFVDYAPGEPRIVDYRAKWAAGSREFVNTPRRFDFPAKDRELLEQMQAILLNCKHLFRLNGHFRVDFRVDPAGRPWVLEVNTNPCLAPDAGFAAALKQAGTSLETALERILADIPIEREKRCAVLRLKGKPGHQTRAAMPVAAKSAAGPLTEVEFREAPNDSDTAAIREIVASTGYFNAGEIDVAIELVQERLTRGEASGYFFLFAEVEGRVAGYTCYGPIACTAGSFDLYWIAVHESQRGRGLGRRLMDETERRIREAGGRRVYIETSSRSQYEPTRGFYLGCGYVQEALLPDFYAPGDGKIVYGKAL